MNEGISKSIEDLREEAIAKVSMWRDEVVGLVGICGRGTHRIVEILEELEKSDIKQEDLERLVAEAEEVKSNVCDFR